MYYSTKWKIQIANAHAHCVSPCHQKWQWISNRNRNKILGAWEGVTELLTKSCCAVRFCSEYGSYRYSVNNKILGGTRCSQFNPAAHTVQSTADPQHMQWVST